MKNYSIVSAPFNTKKMKSKYKNYYYYYYLVWNELCSTNSNNNTNQINF